MCSNLCSDVGKDRDVVRVEEKGWSGRIEEGRQSAVTTAKCICRGRAVVRDGWSRAE